MDREDYIVSLVHEMHVTKIVIRGFSIEDVRRYVQSEIDNSNLNHFKTHLKSAFPLTIQKVEKRNSRLRKLLQGEEK